LNTSRSRRGALEAVLGGGSGEEDEAGERAEEGRQVDIFLARLDVGKAAVEEQDDQEGGQPLGAGQQHPQLLQQVAQILVAHALVLREIAVVGHRCHTS
jgi:hypothetical protein